MSRMLNALEDGYVEGRMGGYYRGARQNLEKKNRWFWEHKDSRGETVASRIASPPNVWASAE